MSRLPTDKVDTLQSWFDLTTAIYAAQQAHLPTPKKPLRWMVLVYLAIHEGSASFTDLRDACGLKDPPSLTQVVKPLKKAKYVTSRRSRGGSHLTLDEPGWNVIEKILKTRAAAS